jgi:hypothetical protein
VTTTTRRKRSTIGGAVGAAETTRTEMIGTSGAVIGTGTESEEGIETVTGTARSRAVLAAAAVGRAVAARPMTTNTTKDIDAAVRSLARRQNLLGIETAIGIGIETETESAGTTSMGRRTGEVGRTAVVTATEIARAGAARADTERRRRKRRAAAESHMVEVASGV